MQFSVKMVDLVERLKTDVDFRSGYTLLQTQQEIAPPHRYVWPYGDRHVPIVMRLFYRDGGSRRDWRLDWGGIFRYEKEKTPTIVEMTSYSQGRLYAAVQRALNAAFDSHDKIVAVLPEDRTFLGARVRSAQAALIGLYLLDGFEGEVLEELNVRFGEQPKLLGALNLGGDGRLITGNIFLDTVYKEASHWMWLNLPRVNH